MRMACLPFVRDADGRGLSPRRRPAAPLPANRSLPPALGRNRGAATRVGRVSECTRNPSWARCCGALRQSLRQDNSCYESAMVRRVADQASLGRPDDDESPGLVARQRQRRPAGRGIAVKRGGTACGAGCALRSVERGAQVATRGLRLRRTAPDSVSTTSKTLRRTSAHRFPPRRLRQQSGSARHQRQDQSDTFWIDTFRRFTVSTNSGSRPDSTKTGDGGLFPSWRLQQSPGHLEGTSPCSQDNSIPYFDNTIGLAIPHPLSIPLYGF